MRTIALQCTLEALYLSKHAAASERSLVLVFKARDFWPMYTAAQSLHSIL